MVAFLLAALLSAPASAGTPPSPDFSLTVDDDLGEAAWRPKIGFGSGRWSLIPVIKAGALALTESFPYAYPILKQSPFALGGFKLAYSGAVEATVVATAGEINLRSRRLIDDPGLTLGSSATKHAGRDLSQNQFVESLYADVGKTFAAPGGWKGAFYAAFDQFAVISNAAQQPLTDMYEASVGTSWLRRSGAHEVSLFGSVGAEYAPKNLYRRDSAFEAVPSARVGGEYALTRDGRRYSAGVEGDTRRADQGVRPYLGVSAGGTSALLAAELRRSRSDFYPDSKAVAASVQQRLTEGLTAGVTGRFESKRYALSPAAENEARVMGELTWAPADKLVMRSRASWAARKKEEYAAQRELETNAASAALPQRGDIRALIAAAPTLNDFLSTYKPGGEAGILAAASEFTSLFNAYNYNKDWNPPNLDSVDEIYRHARQSYLGGTKDPILVCYGAAQYTAFMAEEMGRRAGVPIQAAGVTVRIADAQGRDEGHAVAAIKTRDLGIVFVDWGRLIPTYTFDTGRALRVYQALVGTPALYHQITDPNNGGSHVGYLFTEEGKLYVRNLTFHGELAAPPTAKLFDDDPRGDRLSEQRYRDLLRRQPP